MTAPLSPDEIAELLAALDTAAREMERSACAIEQAEKFKEFGSTRRRLVEGNRAMAKSAADGAHTIRTLLAQLDEAEKLLRETVSCLSEHPHVIGSGENCRACKLSQRAQAHLGARGKEKA